MHRKITLNGRKKFERQREGNRVLTRIIVTIAVNNTIIITRYNVRRYLHGRYVTSSVLIIQLDRIIIVGMYDYTL